MNYERFPGAQYANIFSYLPSDDREGYAELDEETLQLVGDVPGYVGYESVKNAEGRSIFLSYWQSMEAVNQWRATARHKVAKVPGKPCVAASPSMLVTLHHPPYPKSQIHQP